MDIANDTATEMYQALIDMIDGGTGAGWLQIYGGNAPGNVNSPIGGSNVLLAQLQLNMPCATVQIIGTTPPVAKMVFSPISDDIAGNADGIPIFFRITDSNFNHIIQGEVHPTQIETDDFIYQGGKVSVGTLTFEF